jgi:succinylarginine dihydrolase
MAATKWVEVQCDGLIGATHNYAGLSFGNVASQSNATQVSYPRQAALQGLEKMRFVYELGLPQMILPPPLRPNLALLEHCGVTTLATTPKNTFTRAVIGSAWSASTMWSANAATVSPAPDSSNESLHFTIANLASSLHRAQEAEERYALFDHIFGDIAIVHPPLPACTPLTDEGAANHMRLSPSHGEVGVEIFVYGRDETGVRPSCYPARQTRSACQAIAQLHRLPEHRYILAQQHPDAIDAGVFHNDVIAMSNETVMIYHEMTFYQEDVVLEELRGKASFPLTLIRFSEDELPLKDVVASYFFNSQLLTLPSGRMVIVAPAESQENIAARTAFERIIQRDDNPIDAVHYLDVRESMKNGGGPACLRLRVVMKQEEYDCLPDPYRFSLPHYERLKDFITAEYPEMLTPDALYDATLATQMHSIHTKMQSLFT